MITPKGSVYPGLGRAVSQRLLGALAGIACLLPLAAPGRAATAPCTMARAADLVIAADQVVTIQGQTYCLSGDIIVQENARLRIRDTTLIVSQEYERQHVILAAGNSDLELSDVTIQSDKGFRIEGVDDSRVSLARVSGPRSVITANDGCVATADRVEADGLSVCGGARVSVSQSSFSGVRLAPTGPTTIALQGIHPGYFGAWTAQGHLASGELSLTLSLSDTQVGGWGLDVSETGTHVVLADSELNVVAVELTRCSGTIAGLHPGWLEEWHLADLALRNPPCNLDLHNTSVGEWVLRHGAGCDLTVADSRVSLCLWGNGISLAASNTVFGWTGIGDTASLSLQDSVIEGYLELVDAHLFLDGSMHFGTPLEIDAWSSSTVRRAFEVVVVDAAGHPLSDVEVRVSDEAGRDVESGTTNTLGRFRFPIVFSDGNYGASWRITLPASGVTQAFGFQSDTPILVAVP